MHFPFFKRGLAALPLLLALAVSCGTDKKSGEGETRLDSFSAESNASFFQDVYSDVRITPKHHDPILRELCEAALEADADVVLFGHTHAPFRDFTMGMHLLNPGSIGPTTRPSYGIIETDGEKTETKVVFLT